MEYLQNDGRSGRLDTIISGNSGFFQFNSFEIYNGNSEYTHPLYGLESVGNRSLSLYSSDIEFAAYKYDLDVQILKSIIYMENTHGWYDVFAEVLGQNNSQRPANINLEIWGDLFNMSTTEDLMSTEQKTIEIAAALLKQISLHLENPTVQSIATLYNDLGASKVTSYGLTVAEYYRETPWDNNITFEYPSLEEQHAAHQEELKCILEDNQYKVTDNTEIEVIAATDVIEGSTLEFVVKIDGGEPVGHDITFTATTYQGTTSDFVNGRSPDYNGVNGTYTIRASQTQVVIFVPTDQDNMHENTETVELRISNPIGAKISDGIAIGTITDDDEKSLTLTLENFEIDINRFLEDGDDPRVSYIISHDGDENLSSVKLRWYATKNGEVDDDAIFLGYESAGTLRVGERDNEGEGLEPLMDLSGDWKIVTTAEYRGLDDPIVLRVDEVSLSQPLPEMQSVTLDNEQWVNEDNDLRIDYVLHNPTDDDMRGFEIKFYASKSNKFDTDTAIYLDRESGGTLRVGEEDNEGETIQAAADLDAGDWNLYSVAYWDGHEDGVVLSTDEFTVAGNSSSVDLSIDNFRLDDNTLEQGQDLVVRQTSINYGSEDARGTETTYYWSADKHLNVNEDTIIDKDGHGTLRAGEHDTNEYERIDYEDLPKGLGYVFAYIDADQEFDEGLMNELNNHSDWQALYVA